MTSLQTHFLAIDQLLREHEALWRPQPFRTPQEVPWETTHPELAGRLAALSLDEALAIDADPDQHHALLAPSLPGLEQLQALSDLGQLSQRPLPRLGPRAWRHISDRKQAQVQAFIASLPDSDASRWVEWCAGKGHLGRTLAMVSGQPALCLERDAALCEAGRELAEKATEANRLRDAPWSRKGVGAEVGEEGHTPRGHRAPARLGPVSVEMRVQDVLEGSAATALGGDSHAVGLHACGHLHERLLRLAASKKVAAVSVAPCCYHVGAPEVARFEPMSRLARERGVVLSLDDVRLAMQGHGTRSRRRLELHMRGRAWRLGYDALQRDLRGVDVHARLPPVSRRLLRGDFEAFVRAVAELDELEVPRGVEWARYEALGTERLRRVAGLELVRHLFRRPLEVWLALDRALFLAEAGFEVRVGTFCEARWTPRNVMVFGVRGW